MAGALGDRWAIRTQASDEAAGAADVVVAADAAGDVAATKAAAPPSSMVIAPKPGKLSQQPHGYVPLSKSAKCAGQARLWVGQKNRGKQAQRARRRELDAQRGLTGGPRPMAA